MTSAAMGLDDVHIPACIEDGRDLGPVDSEECLWRGALRTDESKGWASWLSSCRESCRAYHSFV